VAQITLRDVGKRYGGPGGPTTFSGLNLDIHSGEFTVLVGPSGCGKSTLLRMIAGLEGITGGTLAFDGVRMNDTPPVDRGVAMVFQNYALYAHMTVAQNIGFGLKIAGVPAAERNHQVARVADQLQLGALLQRKPGQLSGGQRQRVAIGRAIVRQPRVYLFDEPLSNLDASLRAQMRAEIAQLHRSQRATTVYVTHDQVEAMTLADRIVVLSPGKGLEQVGSPDALFDTPANVFVAGFIGSHRMNMVPVVDAQARLLQLITGQSLAALGAQGVATVGVRPEHVSATPGDAGQVQLVERLGVDSLVHLQFAPDSPAFTLLSTDRGLALGQLLNVATPPERLHFFAADGTRLRR
jgi:multiple sugar transport system ATP-binding protein